MLHAVRRALSVLSIGDYQPGSWPDAENGQYVVVVHDVGISLGFSAKGTPPDPVLVASVDPEGWAASQGVVVGDVLLSVGEQQTADMTRRELVRLMKDGERPMSLTFCRNEESEQEQEQEQEQSDSEMQVPIQRKAKRILETHTEENSMMQQAGSHIYSVHATQAIQSLGFAPTGVPPGAVTVARLEPHGWAASQHVAVGDELHMVGTRRISAMTREDIVAALKDRPVNLTLARGASAVAAQVSDAKAALQTVANAARHLREELDTEEATDDLPMVQTASVKAVAVLTFLASTEQHGEEKQCKVRHNDFFSAEVPVGVSDMGFSLTSRWNAAEAWKKMRVKEVEADSWAADQGIAPGDFLLQVGGRNTMDMTKAELTVKLKLGKRPLELAFKKNKVRRSSKSHRRESRIERIDLKRKSVRRSIIKDGSSDAGSVQTTDLLSGEHHAADPELRVSQTAQDGSPYTVVAEEGTLRLGFAPAGDPPARVTVRRLEPNSWAAKNGVTPGDRLVRVGDYAIAEMTRAELVASLQDVVRPLELSFQRPLHGVEAMLARISAAREKLSEAARSAAMAKSELQEHFSRRSSEVSNGNIPRDEKALGVLTALAARASSVNGELTDGR